MKRSEAVAEGASRGGWNRVRGAETKRGAETGRFCGGRGWTEGSVSALRLPDAPNIMFNDINFLLNGPRFDSRCERGPLPPTPSPEPQLRGSRKKYTQENNLASSVEREKKKEAREGGVEEKESGRRERGGYGVVREPNHSGDISHSFSFSSSLSPSSLPLSLPLFVCKINPRLRG